MAKKFQATYENEFYKRLSTLQNIRHCHAQYAVTEEVNAFMVWNLWSGYNALRAYPFHDISSKDAAFNCAKRHIADYK